MTALSLCLRRFSDGRPRNHDDGTTCYAAIPDEPVRDMIAWLMERHLAVGDVLITGIIIYHYGFIIGKRADRARRKHSKK